MERTSLHRLRSLYRNRVCVTYRQRVFLSKRPHPYFEMFFTWTHLVFEARMYVLQMIHCSRMTCDVFIFALLEIGFQDTTTYFICHSNQFALLKSMHSKLGIVATWEVQRHIFKCLSILDVITPLRGLGTPSHLLLT